MKVGSLAGTGKAYVGLQAYAREDGLHIQGKGAEVNRDYGLALNIPRDQFPSDLWDWLVFLTEEKGTMHSLASSLTCYFPIQVRVRPEEETYHFQVKMTDPSFNRSYGAAFDIPRTTYPDLDKFAS